VPLGDVGISSRRQACPSRRFGRAATSTLARFGPGVHAVFGWVLQPWGSVLRPGVTTGRGVHGPSRPSPSGHLRAEAGGVGAAPPAISTGLPSYACLRTRIPTSWKACAGGCSVSERCMTTRGSAW
jgi:hypothetical protein